MRSIQTKYLILILCCILVTSLTVGAIGVVNANEILKEDSAAILNLQCQKEAHTINEMLNNVSKSVNQLVSYAQSEMGDSDRLWSDPDYMDAYTKKVQTVAVSAAENTNGAIAVYFRFNKEYTSPTAGMFMMRESRDGRFVEMPITDLSQYDEDDVKHVGWYYAPINAGGPVWMDPYENLNLGIYMISYIVPIYKDHQLIAILGMDIAMDLLCNNLDSFQAYNTGYAFVWAKNGDLIFHKDFPQGIAASEFSDELKNMSQKAQEAISTDEPVKYTRKGIKKYMKSQLLDNGMTLSICASKEEIEAPLQRLIVSCAASIILFLLIAVFATRAVTKRMTRPIQQLTEAAQKIARGDLDVEIDCRSKDEVGILAKSFQVTAAELKTQINAISELAYMDGLTGVRNKTSYEEEITLLDEQIKAKEAAFGVVVMDINNLKYMNDTYGHEMGDMLILDSARIMKKVFDENKLFRIGGDEFVAVLFSKQLLDTAGVLEQFREEIAVFNRTNTKYEEQLHIAAGISIYRPEEDRTFSEVFRRADARMYEDKALQKTKES